MDQITNGSDKDWISGSVFWLRGTENRISNGFRGANISDMLSKKAQTICKKKHRFQGCKKCTGCRTPNCGICPNCSDMPAFGGPGTSKQKCMKRACINPQMHTCDKCQWNTAALCI